ncbi:MAG: YHS domain-containing protein [Chloroflexota bacterium]|nr:YHS domain-containing protein [Chloroflexota bacterium]
MTDQQSTTMAKDPVCGMEVDPTIAKHSSEYQGKVYSFCSLMCLNAFEDDPRHYLNKVRPGDASPAAGS